MENEGRPNIKFGVDNLESAEEALKRAQANYIGTVIAARFPCNCELCQKGAAKLHEMVEAGANAGDVGDRLHIEVEPLTVRRKVQHIFANETKTIASRWGELTRRV